MNYVMFEGKTIKSITREEDGDYGSDLIIEFTDGTKAAVHLFNEDQFDLISKK